MCLDTCPDEDQVEITVQGYPKTKESDVLNPHLRLSKPPLLPHIWNSGRPGAGPKERKAQRSTLNRKV